MLTKTRLAALCAIFVPAAAAAQPTPANPNPNDPDQPSAPQQQPAQQEVPAPPPAPAPQPSPTVYVNPPPRATVITQDPSSEEVYDAWNAPVFASGTVVFIGSYGASVIAAAASTQDQLDRGNRRLYVPIAGPWLALNDRGQCPIAE